MVWLTHGEFQISEYWFSLHFFGRLLLVFIAISEPFRAFTFTHGILLQLLLLLLHYSRKKTFLIKTSCNDIFVAEIIVIRISKNFLC